MNYRHFQGGIFIKSYNFFGLPYFLMGKLWNIYYLEVILPYY